MRPVQHNDTVAHHAGHIRDFPIGPELRCLVKRALLDLGKATTAITVLTVVVWKLCDWVGDGMLMLLPLTASIQIYGYQVIRLVTRVVTLRRARLNRQLLHLWIKLDLPFGIYLRSFGNNRALDYRKVAGVDRSFCLALAPTEEALVAELHRHSVPLFKLHDIFDVYGDNPKWAKPVAVGNDDWWNLFLMLAHKCSVIVLDPQLGEFNASTFVAEKCGLQQEITKLLRDPNLREKLVLVCTSQEKEAIRMTLEKPTVQPVSAAVRLSTATDAAKVLNRIGAESELILALSTVSVGRRPPAVAMVPPQFDDGESIKLPEHVAKLLEARSRKSSQVFEFRAPIEKSMSAVDIFEFCFSSRRLSARQVNEFMSSATVQKDRTASSPMAQFQPQERARNDVSPPKRKTQA